MQLKNLYTYKAKVLSVYDGDTLTAECDLGFSIKLKVKVRLAGINAPEVMGQQRTDGLKTRDFLRSLVDGKNIILQTTKDKKGKYGRYIGKIWLDNLCVNDLLVSKGLAVYKEY